MKSLHDLKEERDEKVTELIKKCSMFFAFSNEQFHKNKTPLKDGENYVDLGAGCFMPKGNLQTYRDGIAAIEKDFKEQIKENRLRKQNIIYELANHEAWYTGDIEPTLEALGGDYTREEVYLIFRQEAQNQTL